MINSQEIKLLHAPNDIAGQASLLARLQREQGYQAESLSYLNTYFRYATDRSLGLDLRRDPFVKKAFVILTHFPRLLGYDIYHLHASTLLPLIHLDLPILKVLGKKALLNFHGSEVRMDSIASQGNPYIAGACKKEEKSIRAFLTWCSRFCSTVCVGDYELYLYVKDYFPKVEVIPRLVNYQEILPSYPSLENEQVHIVHAPTHRFIKGTDWIIKAIGKLGDQVSFKLVENLPHYQALSEIKKADIYLDQLRVGTFGVSSLEAMALGKAVVCYIRPDLESHYQGLPIVRANRENLAEVLRDLIGNRERLLDLGRRGREYVTKQHDFNRVLDAYDALYQSL